MLGNSLLGNRQLGDSEIGTRAPIYFTATETLTRTDRFALTIGAVASDSIARTEQTSLTVGALSSDTLTRRERVSALINGSPVSLLWRKTAKIISTLWNKLPKP